jgi:hypothetical protein
VVPTLLTWPGSAIVHDIKGENWSLTQRAGRVMRSDLVIDAEHLDMGRHRLGQRDAHPRILESKPALEHIASENWSAKLGLRVRLIVKTTKSSVEVDIDDMRDTVLRALARLHAARSFDPCCRSFNCSWLSDRTASSCSLNRH